MKGKIAVWIAIGIMVLLSLSSFFLPEEIAVQWNSEGVSGTAGPWIVGIFPLLGAAWHFLYTLPKREADCRDIPYLMIPLLLLAVEGIIVSNALEIIRVEQIDKNRIQTAAILLTGWLMALLSIRLPRPLALWYTRGGEWDKAPEFAGKLWFAMGLGLMLLAFFPDKSMLPALLLIAMAFFLPLLYGRLRNHKM